MKYMLDTNVIVMAIRNPKGHICKKLRKHSGGDLCISAITYGELEYGIQKSMFPDRNREARNRMLLGIPILDFDDDAGEEFGEIIADLEKQGKRIGDRDMLIAGHARSLGLTLVTNNTKEFSRVKNLKIEDWK